jgi:hypothetical protein
MQFDWSTAVQDHADNPAREILNRNSCTSFYKYTRIVKFHCTIPFDFEVSLQLLRRWFSCMNQFLIDTLLFSK